MQEKVEIITNHIVHFWTILDKNTQKRILWFGEGRFNEPAGLADFFRLLPKKVGRVDKFSDNKQYALLLGT